MPPVGCDSEEKPFLLSATDPNSEVSSSVWSVPEKDMPSLPERAAGLVSITDAAAAYGAAGQNPYYNGYTAGYGVYGSNPASYYQQVASGLRASNAPFPYAIGATSSYYGGSYPTQLSFNDYSAAAYPSQYYSQMRPGYYGSLANAAAYAGTSLGTDVGDFSSLGMKDKKVKCSKKKKSGAHSPDEQTFVRVFIWELDDITSFSNTTLSQLRAPACARSAVLLKQLLTQLQNLHFSADQTEECDVSNVEDAAMDEHSADAALVETRNGAELMRRLATKFFTLRQMYQDCKDQFSLFERSGMSSQKEELLEALNNVETLMRMRTDLARRCLDLVVQRSSNSQEKYANVVLCSEGLVAGLSQLMLAGHSQSVPIENVYSTNKCGKDAVLDRIQARFGKKCSYVIVTSNTETDHIAKKYGMPVWPTVLPTDLEKLYTAQVNFLLGPA